jgi:hypothetical protein
MKADIESQVMIAIIHNADLRRQSTPIRNYDERNILKAA